MAVSQKLLFVVPADLAASLPNLSIKFQSNILLASWWWYSELGSNDLDM